MVRVLAVAALWLLFAGAAPAQNAELEVSLDRAEIFFGETVTLRIRSTQSALGKGPDYRPLRDNFEVMAPSSNSQMTFNNGVRSVSTEWSVELSPLKTGTLTIPALRVDGGQRTRALSLEVKPRPAAEQGSSDQDVYLEVEAQPASPYVQSQVRFVVKLYYARALTEGTLDEPAPDNAVIQKLGDDVTYQTVRGDRRYMVIERRYAIFPERSGELVIPGLRFRGRLTEDGANSRFGSVFSRGRAVTLRSDAVTLDIRPRPQDYPGEHWLPARSVALRDSWGDDDITLRVGEPATRTLTIEAQGLTETQLPESLLSELEGVRSYPDQPVTSTRTEGVWKYAYREEKRALVPQRPGPLALPPVRLHWWDTEADELRLAEIPARTVQVLPAVAETGALLTPSDLPVVPSERTPVAGVGAMGVWPWLFAGALIGWLATALAWWRTGHSGRAENGRVTPPPEPQTDWQDELRQACQDHDPERAARAVLGLAAQGGMAERAFSLSALAERLVDETQRAQILTLERRLYADGDETWNGEALWYAVREGLRFQTAAAPAATSSLLPPLYPQRTST